MTAMRGIWLHLILTTIMLISFLGSASAYADFRIQCHTEHHESVVESVTVDHADTTTEHAHCSHKPTHCCSSISLMKGEVPDWAFALQMISAFGESTNQLKPSRSLESPFQPPRT